MTPILALAVLLFIYALGEMIAQKSKAVLSTVLAIAILLLAGFWSGADGIDLFGGNQDL